MFFTHPGAVYSGKRYKLPQKANAVLHKALISPVIKEFWQRFTYEASKIAFASSDELIFSVGEAKRVEPDGEDYAINIEESGIFVSAKDERALIDGFMTLIDMFSCEEDGVYADCVLLKESPEIRNRMVHFCVFPDTELWEVKKFIMLAGALKYTHIVIEFWGMLRFDCMEALSWEQAFTKEEIRPLIKEANALGMEVIPMFNHWGHASAGRMMHGKHVVLDRDISLSHLFTNDGWCWNIESEKVLSLQKKIREELSDVCMKGEYFHIGCDEAYGFCYSKENMDKLIGFLNSTANDIMKMGRKPVMWADMMLSHHEGYNLKNRYTAAAPSLDEEKYMLSRVSRDIIMADWQYLAQEAPIETAVTLKNAGFTVLECPYDAGVNVSISAADTVKEHGLFGLMHTTWHTLSSGTGYVGLTAALSWGECRGAQADIYSVKTADVMRKAYNAGGYEKAGWAKKEIGIRT